MSSVNYICGGNQSNVYNPRTNVNKHNSYCLIRLKRQYIRVYIIKFEKLIIIILVELSFDSFILDVHTISLVKFLISIINQNVV